MMNQSSKRLISILITVGFLAGALIVLFELIQPAYADLQAKKAQKMSKDDLLTQEQHTVEQAKKLLNDYDNESQKAGDLVLAMPSGPDVAGAVAQLYGIAQNNAVAVQGIVVVNTPPVRAELPPQPDGSAGTPTLGQVIKPMGSLSLQVTASGNYDNLKRFLAQIETNIRLFDLTSFAIQMPTAAATPGKGVASQGNFSYSMTFSTYYQLP